MFYDALTTGSLVIDVDGDRLDAKYLRENGAIDDYFSIVKGAAPESLRISSFTIRDGRAVVTWKSVAGEAYQIERTANIGAPVWTPVSGRVIASGATSAWSEPLVAGQEKNFYRVVQLRPEPQPAPIAATSAQDQQPSKAVELLQEPLRQGELGRPPYKKISPQAFAPADVRKRFPAREEAGGGRAASSERPGESPPLAAP